MTSKSCFFAILFTFLFIDRSYGQDLFEKSLIISGNTTRQTKFYVFDYWATWCAPCISKMPYFIDLSKNNKDFNFSLISDEPVEKVKNFFTKNRHIVTSGTNILIDQDNFFKEKYQIISLPTTFITNDKGDILWKGTDLDLGILQGIRDGKDFKTVLHDRPVAVNTAYPIFSLSVSDSESTRYLASIKRTDDGHITQYNGKGVTLRTLVSIFGQMSELLIEDYSEVKDRRYDVKISMTDTSQHILPVLLAYFKVEQKTFFKVRDFYALKIVDKVRLFKVKSDTGDKSSSSDIENDQIVVINFGLKEIAGLLEPYLKTPVMLNGTQTGGFDMTLRHPGMAREVNRSLSSYGLALVHSRDRLKVVSLFGKK